MPDETRFCLTPDGVFYHERISRSIVDESFRKKMIDTELRKSLCMSPEIARTNLGTVHLLVPATGIISCGIVRLRAFNFHTHWTTLPANPPAPVLLVPDLHNKGTPVNPNEVAKELLWPIPQEFPTFWMIDLNLLTSSIITFHKYGTEWLRVLFPLPNMWVDSRLCWKPSAADIQELGKMPVIDRIIRLYAGWVNSTWNKDLFKPEFSQVFRWTAEGTVYPPDQPILGYMLATGTKVTPELVPAYNAIEKFLTNNPNWVLP